MSEAPQNPVLRYVRKLLGEPGSDAVSDATLLDRFVARRDEAAFELLMWRHGAMVLGVCRNRLRDVHLAEDAFQATFLVLARKAGSVSNRTALGAWLYQVAYRVALRARTKAGGKAAREEADLDELASRVRSGPADDAALAELRPLLHEEVSRLPAKYRAPVVLCYLEGKSNEEAARQLGWTKGTVSGRLARARELLRRRLERRGVTVAGTALAAVLFADPAALPAALVQSTVKASLLFAAGNGAAGAVSDHVTVLAEGVMKAMFLSKAKAVSAVLALACLLASGGVVTRNLLLAKPLPDDVKEAAPKPPAPDADERKEPARADEPKAPPKPEERKDLIHVPALRDGQLVALGVEVPKPPRNDPNDPVTKVDVGTVAVEALKGEVVREDQRVKVEGFPGREFRRPRDNEEFKPGKTIVVRDAKYFRRLREGDPVKAGDLLGVVDPALAIDELAIKQTALEAAEAMRLASEKMRDEAKSRVARLDEQKRRVAGSISEEEYSGAVITYQRYLYEEIARREEIRKASRELQRALTTMRLHEVRSPAHGVIHAVPKHAGEAVKNYETVVVVRRDADERKEPARADEPRARARPEERKDLVNVPSRRDGVLVLIGSEIAPDEKGTPDLVVTVKVGGEAKKYRRLKEGDLVEEGQLLARTDDRLARDEVTIKEAKREAARAALVASEKTRDEAQSRLARIQRLAAADAVAQEELISAKLVFERYEAEVTARKADVIVAERELNQAKTALEMHEVRSPARGVVHSLYKQPGEAVKALESVLALRIQ